MTIALPIHFEPHLLRGSAMRTLLDLFNNERGYVRVFADRDGFGYELLTYTAAPIGDLFERMSGYRSLTDASAAALDQLSAARQPLPRARKRTTSRRRSA